MSGCRGGVRLALLLALLAAGGYGIKLHSGLGTAPAATSDAPPVAPADLDTEAAERDLRQRFEVFRELKLEDDHVALYDLVDPMERTAVDLRTFLEFYDHGFVRVNELTLESIDFDWEHQRAVVSARTMAELVLENLPPQYRPPAPENPDDLKVDAPHKIRWVRRDGRWYFCLDEQLVRGKTSEGAKVRPL